MIRVLNTKGKSRSVVGPLRNGGEGVGFCCLFVCFFPSNFAFSDIFFFHLRSCFHPDF